MNTNYYCLVIAEYENRYEVVLNKGANWKNYNSKLGTLRKKFKKKNRSTNPGNSMHWKTTKIHRNFNEENLGAFAELNQKFPLRTKKVQESNNTRHWIKTQKSKKMNAIWTRKLPVATQCRQRTIKRPAELQAQAAVQNGHQTPPSSSVSTKHAVEHHRIATTTFWPEVQWRRFLILGAIGIFYEEP